MCFFARQISPRPPNPVSVFAGFSSLKVFVDASAKTGGFFQPLLRCLLYLFIYEKPLKGSELNGVVSVKQLCGGVVSFYVYHSSIVELWYCFSSVWNDCWNILTTIFVILNHLFLDVRHYWLFSRIIDQKLAYYQWYAYHSSENAVLKGRVIDFYIYFRRLFSRNGSSIISCSEFRPLWVVTSYFCRMITESKKWHPNCGVGTIRLGRKMSRNF